MSYIANLTSPYIGNLWTANNVNTISSALGNILVVSGNAAPSVANFTFGNIDISGNLNLNGNLKVPVGNTLTRPFGVQGYTRYNTTTSNMEFYNGTSWISGVNAAISITIPNPNGGNGIVLTSLWQPGFNFTFQYIAVGNQNTNSFYGTSTTPYQSAPVPNNTYLITTTGTITASFVLNGAGGGGGGNLGSGVPNIGGNGGQTTGTYTLVSGTTYYLVVGGGGAFVVIGSGSFIPSVGAGGAGNVGTGGAGGQGGGYTGLFINSVSQPNAIMIAGGGGGGSWETNPSTPSGGAGGGSSGNAGANGNLNGGGGGTQIAGGSGPSSNPGSALQGGTSSGSDPNGGGGGGGGYFGGGGGSGDGNGSGGGGGSGYFNPSVVTGGATTTGAGATGGPGGTGGQSIIVYGGNGSATMTYVG